MKKPINTHLKPKHRKDWTQYEVQRAAHLFMEGDDHETIGLKLGFTAQRVRKKLNSQGFTLEYRKNKLVGAVNQ